MTTVRPPRRAVLLPVIVGLAMSSAGCRAGQPSSEPGRSTAAAAITLASQPAGSVSARADPAVWAAVRFELARCRWDWHEPHASYVAAQQAYATPAYATVLARSADAASWAGEVVAERQVVTCAVSDAHRAMHAPTTPTRVFVRMTVSAHISSMLGSFAAGAATASWLVALLRGEWLVNGPFEGG